MKIRMRGVEFDVSEREPASLDMPWIEACGLLNRLEDVINRARELEGGMDRNRSDGILGGGSEVVVICTHSGRLWVREGATDQREEGIIPISGVG